MEGDVSEMSAVLRTRQEGDSMMKSLVITMEECVEADGLSAQLIKETL
jgi:hypothetical protein